MKSQPDAGESPVEILIVEDSPTQAQRLRYILEQQGYQIRAAPHGSAALQMARDAKPAVIISDVMMPEMDGYELCRRLKSDEKLLDIPVILVTTLSDPQDVIRGLECHADYFILKPYDESYLLGRVQFVLVNREMREAKEGGMGVEIFFNGQRHFITAQRLQILNLLLSTYEAAIQRNSELTRAHNELRRLNDRLEVVNKELEAFSYSVSHDLRAPLRHIQGYVSMLQDTLGDQLPEKAQRFLNVINNAGNTMNQLIDDLLTFSRMGQVEMRESCVSLNPLISECITNLELVTRDRTINWTIAQIPPVKGDASLLRQVLANVISNAIKYTRPRDPAKIEIGFRQENPGEIIVFVRDNGVGFDMKYANRLFGVFQRLHRAEDFEGTGIGLANVRRIIARHGGKVWADSVPNEETVFSFTIPECS